MNSEPDKVPTLREMELEVEAEGREWMRRRLEAKLQAQADRHGGVFPPKRTPGVASAAGAGAAAHGLRGGRADPVGRRPTPRSWGARCSHTNSGIPTPP